MSLQAVTEYFNPIQSAEVHRLVQVYLQQFTLILHYLRKAVQCMTQTPAKWVSFISRAMSSIVCLFCNIVVH